MFIPDDYSYTIDIEKTRFTVDSTGQVEVPRLVDGDADYWIDPAQEKKQAPKVLVLTDWTLAHKTEADVWLVRDMLLGLLNPNHLHQLFIWYNDDLFDLTPENLNCFLEYTYLEAITPVSEEVITDLLSKKGIPRGAIKCLDAHEFERLATGTTEDFTIKISDLYRTKHHLESILSVLDGTKPVIFHDDTHETDYDQYLSKITARLERLGTIKRRIETVGPLTYVGVSSLIQSGADLTGVKKIIDVQMIPSDADLLLTKTPNVEQLAIDFCVDVNADDKDKTLVLEGIVLPQLTTWDISEWDISAGDVALRVVHHIFSHAKGLSSLKVHGFQLVDGLILPPDITDLEVKMEDSQPLGVEAFQTSLSQVKQLKRLRIEGNFNFSDFRIERLKASPTHPFTALESLDVLHSNMTTEVLSYFLNQTTQLKKLVVVGCGFLNDEYYDTDTSTTGFTLNPGVLSELEILILENGQTDIGMLSTEGFNILLREAVNLKMFRLIEDCCDAEMPSFALLPQTLVWVDVSVRPLEFNNLRDMLNAIRTLKFLNIRNADNLEYVNHFRGGDIFDVKTLNFANAMIDLNGLSMIINQTQDLKALDLNSGSSLGTGVLNLEAGKLSGLISLDVSSGTKRHSGWTEFEDYQNNLLSFPNLKQMLTQTRRLAHLNLSGLICLFDEEPMLSHALFPSTLETLDLSHCTIAVETLLGILNKNPRLHTLSLSEAKILGDEALFSDSSQTFVVSQLVLSRAVMNPKVLKSFLKACPNLMDLSLNKKQKEQLSSDDVLDEAPYLAPFLQVTEEDEVEDAAEARMSAQTEEVFSNPVHSAKSHKNFMPTPDTFVFEYQKKQTKNQTAIIGQLSQYLTLTGKEKNSALIREIQNGICSHLSSLFSEMTERQFVLWREHLLNWDGQQNSLDMFVRIAAGRILALIQAGDVDQKTEAHTYIGDAMADFIADADGEYRLVNPWHEIVIRYLAPESNDDADESSEESDDVVKHTWVVFDSNFVNGEQRVEESALCAVIYQSLGKLVSVRQADYACTFDASILNAAEFIKTGGLLLLDRRAFLNDAAVVQDMLSGQHDLEVLDGLFLRSNTGIPAWFYGLKNTVYKPLFDQLITSLIEQSPHDFLVKMEKSMEAMSDRKQAEGFDLLAQYESTRVKYIDYDRRVEAYKQALSVSVTPSEDKTPTEWISRCLRNPYHKNLLEFKSDQEIIEAICEIQKQAQAEEQPVFFVHHPRDLVCSAPYIQEASGKGVMMRGPGGALDAFLKAEYPTGVQPLIIVNYANFDVQDVVRFNTLLDAERVADGTPVPDHFKIIGLVNTKSEHYYAGEDFYSRLNTKEPSRFAVSDWQDAPVHEMQLDQVPYVIDLFHSDNWKARLMGSWTLEGKDLLFKPGLIQAALASGQQISIQNPPVSSKAAREFELFWRQNRISGELLGHKLPNIQVVDQAYDWDALFGMHTVSHVPAEVFLNTDDMPFLLNPSTAQQLLSQSVCDKTHKVFLFKLGVLQTHKNQFDHPLKIQVTRSLSDNDWAELMTEAAKLDVKLDISILPGVKLPEGVLLDLKEASTLAEGPSEPSIIHTNDVDASVLLLKERNPDTFIELDISEYAPYQLLQHTEATFDQDTLSFTVDVLDKIILRALEAGKKVILKGQFSSKLADALLPHLSNKAHHLMLVTDDVTHFESVGYQTEQIEVKQKKYLLNQITADLPFSDTDIARHPYATLRAVLCHDAAVPDFCAPWQGIQSLETHFDLGQFNPEKAAADTAAFTAHRLAEVQAAFKKSPIACLSGMTGVGKSTFVSDVLKPTSPVFIGESALSSWANERDGGVLFIDEANMANRDWCEFEGLRQDPPHILVDDEWVRLSPNHTVLFGFNPGNYGGERETSRLFARHGNTVIFEPLPLNVIYQLVLLPLFERTGLQAEAAVLSEDILAAYAFLCSVSKERTLMTVRELKSIVMLSVAHHEQTPAENPKALVRHYIRKVAADLLPRRHHTRFEEQFPEIALGQTRPVLKAAQSTAFVQNDTTSALGEHLDSFLHLRAYRQVHQADLSVTHLTGDISGCIFEGEAGLGKSHFVLDRLSAFGLEPADLATEAPQAHVFYHIPISMQLDQKKALILKAFHEGNVVLMDEINSSLMMERLLNALLMGKTADDQTAGKPGFFVIGTQNSIALGGRNMQSDALLRRVSKKDYPLYTESEMIDLLESKGVEPLEAKMMIQAYLLRREEALNTREPNLPSFRNVLNLLEMQQAQIAAEPRPCQQKRHYDFFPGGDEMPEKVIKMTGSSSLSRQSSFWEECESMGHLDSSSSSSSSSSSI